MGTIPKSLPSFFQALRYMSWTHWACWRFRELICCYLFLTFRDQSINMTGSLGKTIVFLMPLMVCIFELLPLAINNPILLWKTSNQWSATMTAASTVHICSWWTRFDIDFLNLGCVVPDSGPSLTFLSQLMAYPAFSCCMLVVWWCIGRWGRFKHVQNMSTYIRPIQKTISDSSNSRWLMMVNDG